MMVRFSRERKLERELRENMESSETREYPSLIQTFFDTHTDGDKFAKDEAQVQYVRRDDPTEGSMREYADGILVRQDRDAISINEPQGTYTDTDVNELESHNEVGGGSGSGQGDDEPSAYEDACRDEEI
uniref:Uncharacterized protein n=1 Tax=Tanacetum cinerariifolium TaxID=118510 RepID=A0A6L2KQR3_TANCI|nr:hypothetical protein [Tanacetum cinerariifolium]